jgi:hypothetical protein
MANFVPVDDEVLERARTDPNFRQKLVSDHLDRLMAAMNRAKKKINADVSQQLQEGAQLAVKLADILHAIGDRNVR